ncbi:MAG: SIMPL domain-containing protein [Myxococcota bacterium]|jgi:hypothetical protein|nr:SIMPL domain-containing protein [Myxococcota bacterium]
MTFNGERISLGLIAIGAAAIISTYLAASAWERVKTMPPDRTITVTGSAKKRIVSDQIEWTANLQAQNVDRTSAYRELHQQMQTTLGYLNEQGLKDGDIRPGSVSVEETFETEYVGVGDQRIERQVFKGYKMNQPIIVRSEDVTLVERLSREISQLFERGVAVTSYPPAYYYTKLGELKIEMLAEASKDARNRAENIVQKAGDAELGKLRSADMGVINVNPANSTDTSWQGNNDSSSLEKDILTIVHVVFELH